MDSRKIGIKFTKSMTSFQRMIGIILVSIFGNISQIGTHASHVVIQTRLIIIISSGTQLMSMAWISGSVYPREPSVAVLYTTHIQMKCRMVCIVNMVKYLIKQFCGSILGFHRQTCLALNFSFERTVFTAAWALAVGANKLRSRA